MMPTGHPKSKSGSKIAETMIYSGPYYAHADKGSNIDAEGHQREDPTALDSLRSYKMTSFLAICLFCTNMTNSARG
jgi:hypothetical protein